MELFDLYDPCRRPTGETMLRGEPTPEGRYRLVVHICIFNTKGEMLIQQRQSFKSTWANMWDLTAAGGVISGETTQDAARRELFEELGLDVDFTSQPPAFSSTFPGGFDDFYILEQDLDISTLRCQPEEVQALKWSSLEEVLAMIDSGEFIPYHKGFLQFLFYRQNGHGTLVSLYAQPKEDT